MEEIWKDVKGYESLYQVSNFGSVKSLDLIRVEWYGTKKFYKGKILKGVIQKSGYIAFDLYKHGKRKSIRCHVLVAKAFLPNNDNDLVVNHKDGNKQNNKLENLEWITFKENVRHAFKNRLMVKKGFDVLNLETGIFYESIGDAYRSYSLNFSLSFFKKSLAKNPEKITNFLIV
jgi:hypothetical protein